MYRYLPDYTLSQYEYLDQTNLALKGIIGIYAFGDMAKAIGNKCTSCRSTEIILVSVDL